MIELKCYWCGNTYMAKRYKLNQKHHFCSRDCLWKFQSKKHNPDGYRELKDYSSVSKHMSDLNRELNPTRMTNEVKEKLRKARLKDSTELKKETYRKTHGRHTHRVIVEEVIGRKLKPTEIVHHINGDRHDNRLVNLMLFENQSEHVKWHKCMGVFEVTGITEKDLWSSYLTTTNNER